VALASALALVVLALGLVRAPSALANDRPGWSVVEASQDFCVNPRVNCGSTIPLANLGYEEIAAVNFNGRAYATPSAVVLVCAKTYRANTGNLHTRAGHVFAGPTANGYDDGNIYGTMQVFNGATESTTRATGAVGVFATDPKLHTSGIADGWQVTNNATDRPLGSWITVTIWGQLEDQNMTTKVMTMPQGAITCNIHLPFGIGASAPGQPPDSESVLSDTDSD
jgi:hypothetical protein